MSDTNWEELYLLAALEVDSQKIQGRIDATRAAIAERLRHLEPASEHLKERQDVEKCLKAMELLEAETGEWV
jgi:hypothetical protein